MITLTDATDYYQNYDAVLKEALTLYNNKSLAFLGLDIADVDVPISTEFTTVKVEKSFTDSAFKLKNGTGLHLEWEADISTDDLLRFAAYHVAYVRQYKMKFVTVIVTNSPQTIVSYKNDVLEFKPIVIDLSARDGDALLEKIKGQIERGERVNELEMIYLPLYHSKDKSVAELFEKVITLAPKVSSNIENNQNIMLLSALLCNKFIPGPEYKRIWEVIRMYVDELFIVKMAKEEARKEARKEARDEKALEDAKAMLEEGDSLDKIARVIKFPLDVLKEKLNIL
jgi:hypothetical protein